MVMKEPGIQVADVDRVIRYRERGIIGQAPQVRTSVLVPLLQDEDGQLSVLFTKRALSLRRQPGEISFPGGHREASDVDDAATALRETSEELGLDPADISYIGALDVLVAWSGLLVYPHVGVLTRPAAIHPNPAEVAEVFTVPLHTLLNTQPAVYDVSLQPQPPQDFPYHLVVGGKGYQWRTTKVRQYFYTFGEHVVWGLTARILTHFLDVLRAAHLGEA
jgi:coenzyme A diphosphatase NUDT7